MSMLPLGLFGGTFDPIHTGHLRTAQELLTGLGLGEVRFLPSALPPHRPPPVAPPGQRLQMLEAALAGLPGFRVDTRELDRPGPSYTVDTLTSLRSEVGSRPLCLLLGLDAFLGLPTWHRWQAIPELAHVVVARRPGSAPPTAGAAWELLRARASTDPRDLAASPAGRVLTVEITQLEISSSAIRDLVGVGGDPRFLLPDAVHALIEKHHIYAQPQEARISAQ